jgi:hypothetical protein
MAPPPHTNGIHDGCTGTDRGEGVAGGGAANIHPPSWRSDAHELAHGSAPRQRADTHQYISYNCAVRGGDHSAAYRQRRRPRKGKGQGSRPHHCSQRHFAYKSLPRMVTCSRSTLCLLALRSIGRVLCLWCGCSYHEACLGPGGVSAARWVRRRLRRRLWWPPSCFGCVRQPAPPPCPGCPWPQVAPLPSLWTHQSATSSNSSPRRPTQSAWRRGGAGWVWVAGRRLLALVCRQFAPVAARCTLGYLRGAVRCGAMLLGPPSRRLLHHMISFHSAGGEGCAVIWGAPHRGACSFHAVCCAPGRGPDPPCLVVPPRLPRLPRLPPRAARAAQTQGRIEAVPEEGAPGLVWSLP